MDMDIDMEEKENIVIGRGPDKEISVPMEVANGFPFPQTLGVGPAMDDNMLLKLPDVVREQVLDYLLIPHLFALRLTSKTMNGVITEYINRKSGAGFHFEIVQQLSQSEETGDKEPGTGMTFRDVLDYGYVFPIRSLYLKNEDAKIFQDPDITNFLEIYGSKIQKLKIENLPIVSRPSHRFFQKLDNLTELKILNVKIPKTRLLNSHTLERFIPPETFAKVEVLKVDKITYTYSSRSPSFNSEFPLIFLEKFPNLRVLRLPKIYMKDRPHIVYQYSSWKYDFLSRYIKTQRGGEDDRVPKLVKIDLKNVEIYELETQACSRSFVKFLDDIHRCPLTVGIKFYNVNEKLLSWFDRFTIVHSDQVEKVNNYKEGLDNHIETMKNLSQSVMDLELNKITKLDVNVRESLQRFGQGQFSVPQFWSGMLGSFDSLVKLRIIYDQPCWSQNAEDCENLRGQYAEMEIFLFHCHFYHSLKELCLEFGEAFTEPKTPHGFFNGRCLMNHFWFVKKLELINWNPANKMFVRIWKDIGDEGQLEELIVKDCATLGNVGFIGEDKDNPAFLKLKSLRKLTLKVDRMQKLSDRAFKDVFRHMSLTEFVIISEKPMEKITRTGIEWLLQGSFAKSILKFPFTTWTATTIPPEEMMPLKAQFKSLIY